MSSGPPVPRYQHPPAKVREHRTPVTPALLENAFFVVAMVLSFLFAVVVIRQSITHPSHVLYVLVFYAVIAYLALPRLHRVLTTLYVPDYFIGRARTTDGLVGDPINLAFTGSREQIREVMARAGWVEADPVNLRSAVRIVTASLSRRSYPHAPVSPLLLFGQVQDLAFQQEVEGNPAQRHHVRFWPCPEGWVLPGGHHADWVAAATYDRSVGLSLFTFQVTHRIDRDIDIERDYLVETLRYAVGEVDVRTIEEFSTGYHCRNGGGDQVVTDGALPVVDVSQVVPTTPVPEVAEAHTHGVERVRDEVGRRPFPIIAAPVLMAISFLLSTAVTVGDLPPLDTFGDGALPAEHRWVPMLVIGATYLLGAGIVALLAGGLFHGYQIARWVLIVMTTISLISQVLQYLGSLRPPFLTILGMSVDLLTIYALTSMSARTWVRERVRERRLRREQRRTAAAHT